MLCLNCRPRIPAYRLDELKRRAQELALSGRVSFSGQVLPNMVPLALSGVDAIVIPFQTDTEFLSPIKLYEGLTLGLPIIATPTPALVELSQTIKSLVVAEYCSSESLAVCVQSLFSDNDRLNTVRGCAMKRNDVCTWKVRANKILESCKN